MSDSTTCPNCSATLPAGATFCTSCGTRTAEAPGAVAAPPAEEATRVDNPALHDATQTYSTPPPSSPWQPADAPSTPPAPPPWHPPPVDGPSAAPAGQAPAPPGWSPAGAPQPPQPAWQQAQPAAPPQAWGTAPPAAPQWGSQPSAPPHTAPAHTTKEGGSLVGALIALVGGILTLVGLFTAWIGTNQNDETTTGWALASGDEGLKSNDPYLILGLGIAALVLGVLLFTGASRIIVRIAAVVVGLAVVGIAARDWVSIADLAKDMPSTVEITAQFGFYLTIAGGIVTALAALMPAKKVGA